MCVYENWEILEEPQIHVEIGLGLWHEMGL